MTQHGDNLRALALWAGLKERQRKEEHKEPRAGAPMLISVARAQRQHLAIFNCIMAYSYTDSFKSVEPSRGCTMERVYGEHDAHVPYLWGLLGPTVTN